MAETPWSVSVIIRTKNEQEWIERCLRGIYSQETKPLEVIVVDNCSSDNTVELARDVGVDQVLTLEQYTPGLALNLGVEAAKGEIVCMISAHCVPANPKWLARLIEPFEDPSIIASYGRQLPLPGTDPSDKSDLYSVFRSESFVQEVDGFLNNANSAIRRRALIDKPFDESVSNIEDRVWGQEVVSPLTRIAYASEAVVFHHNGLHRTSSRRDQSSTIQVLESRVVQPNLQSLDFFRTCFKRAFLPVVFAERNSYEPSNLEGVLSTTQDFWATPVIQAISYVDPEPSDCPIDQQQALPALSRMKLLVESERFSSTSYFGVFDQKCNTRSPDHVAESLEAIVTLRSRFEPLQCESRTSSEKIEPCCFLFSRSALEIQEECVTEFDGEVRRVQSIRCHLS